MLVLFETAAGFAVFKLLDEKKLEKSENLFKDFESIERANKIVQLHSFKKFADSAEALEASVALNEGKLCKPLKKLLKKIFVEDVQDKLMVWDPKLGTSIKDKLGLQIVSSGGVVGELMRCIKTQVDSLIPGLQEKELSAMSLGLGHNLSRYKLKFSPDKVDTMIVQAVNLLDDIDKELNNYVMRAREWYGWHFPELGKILTDNTMYIKTIMTMGTRDNAKNTDFSRVLTEDEEESVKIAAEISMGTEVAKEDIDNILCLCEQISELTEYRGQLYEYLKNRMHAIAPNLNILVGELVGARLISHAGSLLNLAKHPASTIQILGAEKALFRALKEKKATPKFGLMYHAQMVANTSTKNKGKISRMLAAKAALAIRYDALGEETNTDMGMENRAKLTAKLNFIESGKISRITGQGRTQARNEKYSGQAHGGYDDSQDNTLDFNSKRKFKEESEEEKENPFSRPQAKKVKIEELESEETPIKAESTSPKKKKRKSGADTSMVVEAEAPEEPTSEKKKKKKKSKSDSPVKEEPMEEEVPEPTSEKKKKKKKKPEADTSVVEEVKTPEPSSEKKKKKKKKVKEESD